MRMLVTDVADTATFAVHDDGFAMWKTEPQWHMGHPAHEVWLHDLAAATPEAHAALWHTLLSLDLTGPIRSLVVPIDDPLPYLLTDRRALRTTVVNDGLWLNLRDVKRCFEARTYGTDDDIVSRPTASVGGSVAADARGCAAEPTCRRITPRCRRCSWAACGLRRWWPGGG